MSNPPQERPLLIYDAECRFCVFSKRRMVQWDKNRRIRFVAFHEEAAEPWAKERVGADGITRMQFVEFVGASGTVSSGVSAFRAVLRYLPMGKVIACLFYLPGMAWIAERIYQFIAKNRRRGKVNGVRS